MTGTPHRRAWRAARALWPAALFVAMPLLVFPLAWLADGAMDPKGDDTLGFFPYIVASAHAFWRGDILWTDSLFLGTPLLAQPEFAVFYPLRLFIPLLPPVAAYTLYVLLHYVIAQACMYAYLRQLGASRLAAATAGVAYGFSAMMMGHRGHANFLAAAAWAPLFFFFLERAERRRGRLAFLGAALVAALHAFTGAFQLLLYLGSATALLAGTRAVMTRRWRPLLVAAGALIPAALIAALQALPSLELSATLALADRGRRDIATTYSWHPALAPALFVIDAFAANEAYSRVGALVLAAALTMVVGGWRRPRVRGWALVAGVALLLMTGKYLPVITDLLLRLPVIDVFRSPVRHHFELGLALPVLAGLAVDRFVLRRRPLPARWWAWALGLPLLFAGAVAGARRLAPHATLEPFAAGWVRNLPFTAAIFPASVAVAWVLAARLARTRRAAVAAALLLLGTAGAEVVLSAHNTVPEDWSDRDAELARADFRRDRTRPARVLTIKEESAFGLDTLSGTTPLLLDGIQRIAGFATAAPRDAVALLGLSMQGAPDDIDDLRWSRVPSIFGATHLLMPAAVCQDLDFTFDQPAADAGLCTPALTMRPLTVTSPGRACMLSISEAAPTFELVVELRSAATGVLDLRMGDDRRQVGEQLRLSPGRRFVRRRIPIPLHAVPPVGMLIVTPLSTGAVELRQPRLMVRWSAGGPWLDTRVIGTLPGEGEVGKGITAARGVYRFAPWAASVRLPYHLPRRPLQLLLARGEGSPAPRLAIIAEVPGEEQATRLWRIERVVEPADITRTSVFHWAFGVPPDLTRLRLYVERLDATSGHAWVHAQGMDACRQRRIVSARPLDNGLWVYENDEALPRAYTVMTTVPARDLAQTRHLLRYAKGFVPGETAVVPLEAGLPASFTAATVPRADFGQEQVEIEVLAPKGEAFLVINDRFDPGWEAWVDGSRARIYRVNGMVRGVRVPRGHHVVSMRYRAPRGLLVGAGLAALGLLLALVAIPWLDRRAGR